MPDSSAPTVSTIGTTDTTDDNKHSMDNLEDDALFDTYNKNSRVDMSSMSYSICLDTKNQDKTKSKLAYPLSRKTRQWVDDDTVNQCYNCNKDFAFLVRKHHCRLCGKIFCYECSNFWQFIPENLLSPDSKKGTWNNYIGSYVSTDMANKQRVCLGCSELIDKVNSVKKIIEVFSYINFDIRDIKKIAKVTPIWKNAANYCLSIFREIQYKLPSEEFTPLEKKMLWSNTQYLVGHSKYLLALLKVATTEEEMTKVKELLEVPKQYTCWSTMCSRNCKEKLNSIDSINLLAHCFKQKGNTDELKRVALKYLRCSDKEFKCYIQFLVYNMQNDSGIISDFLIKRCLNNFSLLTSLYWEIKMYPKDQYHEKAYAGTLVQLKKIFSTPEYEQQFVKLLQGDALVKTLEEIKTMITEKEKTYEEIKDKYVLKNETLVPVSPENKIKRICLEKIQIKDSVSKPMIIPCELSDGKIFRLMMKNDDLRRDQIVLNIIQLLEIIVRREEQIELDIVSYNVLPTGKNKGIIEIVNESDTIYFIQEKLQSSILNYILENNGHLKVEDVRNRFIRSTAAYCVITYLLGVGDRHLENIMVTKDGRLFHIDFGYILGKDPVFNNPGIRITPEIIDAIGGLSSVFYPQFVEICSRIYNCVRRNIDIFMNMMLLIPKISTLAITDDEIYEQIMRRFIPGESEIDAKMHIVNKMERQKYTEKVKDFFHYHSKEKTISSTVNRLSAAVSGLWTPPKPEEQQINL